MKVTFDVAEPSGEVLQLADYKEKTALLVLTQPRVQSFAVAAAGSIVNESEPGPDKECCSV